MKRTQSPCQSTIAHSMCKLLGSKLPILLLTSSFLHSLWLSLGVDLEALFDCFFFSSAVEEVHWHTNTTSANYHRQPSSTAADAFGSINQRSCRRVATAAFERINNGNDLWIDFKSVLILTPSIGLRYLLQELVFFLRP